MHRYSSNKGATIALALNQLGVKQKTRSRMDITGGSTNSTSTTGDPYSSEEHPTTICFRMIYLVVLRVSTMKPAEESTITEIIVLA